MLPRQRSIDVAGQWRWVSGCTILSRVLGLVRDAAMAAQFGNGPLLDAFTVAFRLPNLARAILGEGALATAFLPAYVAERDSRGEDAARRLATAVLLSLAVFLILLLGLVEAGLILARSWGDWTAEADLLLELLIWLTPYLGLICVAAQLAALLNAQRRFIVAALIPSILNLVWLITMVCLPWWEHPRTRLLVMAAGVLVGGVGQVLWPWLALTVRGFSLHPGWREAWPQVRSLAWKMLPVVGGLMVTQMNSLIDSLLAWSFAAPEGVSNAGYPLSAGTASALYFGQRLYQFPLGVFGVALGTVLFPLFAEHAQARQYDRLKEDFDLGLRYVIAIGLPASVGLMLLAHPLASACFEYGSFDADDTRQTARMIVAYGSGVWAYCGLLIINRGFYALDDRWTPLKLGFGAVILNFLASLLMLHVGGGVALAATTAVVSMLQCLAAAWLFREKLGRWPWTRLARTLKLAAGCALLMGLAGGLTLEALTAVPGIAGRLGRVALPLAVSVATYFTAARLNGFQEPWELMRRRRESGSSVTQEPT